MTDPLGELLAGTRAPGVHTLPPSYDAASVHRAAEVAGWRCAHLDAWSCETKAEVLDGLGAALGFGEHYGRNLDALADCLDDVTGRTVLLWEGWGAFAVTDERTCAVVLDILARRAGSRRDPFTVLLLGAGPALRGLTPLSA